MSLFKKCTCNEDPKLIKMMSCKPNALSNRNPNVKPSTIAHDYLKSSCKLSSAQGHCESPWENK